jgi:hypothetical protein
VFIETADGEALGGQSCSAFLYFFFGYVCNPHLRTEQTDLQWPISVNRNYDSLLAIGLGKNVMASLNANAVRDLGAHEKHNMLTLK